MRVTVTTKSGSVYRFTQGEDDRIYITRNFKTTGLLADAVEIIPGQRMEIEYYPMNFSGVAICGEKTGLFTTPVKSVVVD